MFWGGPEGLVGLGAMGLGNVWRWEVARGPGGLSVSKGQRLIDVSFGTTTLHP